jgi:hypothetical protein
MVWLMGIVVSARTQLVSGVLKVRQAMEHSKAHFEGLTACETCEVNGTEDCGGGETLRRMLENVR